jgi:hypothetical protein
MNKKTVGIIMMAVGGVVAAVTLVLLVKWYPFQVGTIVVAGAVGFVGYTIYKKG